MNNHREELEDTDLNAISSVVNTIQPADGVELNRDEQHEPVELAECALVYQQTWLAHHPNLPGWLRWFCLISAVGSLGLLAIARSLTPSPLGMGTHQQLGLPPCTSMLLWNVRCPACGMTTSWAWATRGELVAAAAANGGGLMLAGIALAFFPAGCYFFATGRATRGYWFSTLLTVSLVAALALAIVQWAVRISS